LDLVSWLLHPSVPTIKEVLHYKEALWFGNDELNNRPILSTNLFIKIVQIIKKNDAGIRNVVGTQLKNPTTGKVVYTPPEGETTIREKLKNLEDFIHSKDEIDPLIKMAIIHYQFEAIHPFFDGNGRTGRIILLLYLKLTGLLELPALYLSKYIIEHKSEYYKHLRKVTEKEDWINWILYMLDMIEKTAIHDRLKITEIEKLMTDLSTRIQAQLPKIYSKDLIEVLFKLPYTKRKFLVDAGIGNFKTVGNYLKELEDQGFLKSEKVGKEKLYLNYKLLSILNK
jgi:Fic family protein